MKENTQGSNAELYLGEMITDEKGKVTIPPKYSYKVTFNDKNCMIIPLEETKTNLASEDIEVLKGLSPLLGKVDLEGQAREITLVDTFLDTQLEKAEEMCRKNNKLYKNLGVTVGIAIAIIMI